MSVEFDEEGIRARYLDEVERLKGLGKFKNDSEYITAIGMPKEYLWAVRNMVRNKVNLKVLWLSKKLYPDFDFNYVVWGKE